MEELCVVRPRHMLGVHSPRHVFRKNLSVVGRIRYARTTPVLGVDEVGSLESFPLVVFDLSTSNESWVEFVAFRMGDHEVNVGRHHPLCERVGNGLWQSAAVGSPCEDNLGTLPLQRFTFLVPRFFDGDEVGESLQRMDGRSLHCHDGPSAILSELLDDGFGIVVFAIGEPGK